MRFVLQQEHTFSYLEMINGVFLDLHIAKMHTDITQNHPGAYLY